MKICKKCGSQARPNTYQAGYYCNRCGNLDYNDVYSEIDMYNELKK